LLRPPSREHRIIHRYLPSFSVRAGTHTSPFE
jgi:hypothetical protein